MRSIRVLFRKVQSGLCFIIMLSLWAAGGHGDADLRRGSTGRSMGGTLDAGAMDCAGAPRDCGDSSNFVQTRNTRRDQDSPTLCVPETIVRQHRPWPLPQIAHASLSKTANGHSPYTRSDFRSGRPTWINSGIWSLSGRSLLLLDTRDTSILNVLLDEEIVSRVSAFNSRTGTALNPWRIQSDGDRYLLQSHQEDDGALFLLDNNYSIVRRIRYEDQGRPEEGFIGSMNQWVPTRNGEIVAFGDISRTPNAREKNDWFTAVIRFSYDEPENFKTIPSHSKDYSTLGSSSMEFARLGNPIIAAVGGTAYVLLAEGNPVEPRIFEVRSTLRQLPAFPNGYNQVPRLNYDKDDPESIPRFYRQLESMQVAVGLYSQGDSLYLLTRQPDVSGDWTSWILHRIDPRTEQVLGKVMLETKAPHISLIPGKEEWAIIEKARVEKIHEQRIDAIVRVRTSWIEERTGGVAMTGKLQPAG